MALLPVTDDCHWILHVWESRAGGVLRLTALQAGADVSPASFLPRGTDTLAFSHSSLRTLAADLAEASLESAHSQAPPPGCLGK